MILPWLAMPAATSAICSGVAATLYCPIADWAANAGDFRSASVGSWPLGVERIW